MSTKPIKVSIQTRHILKEEMIQGKTGTILACCIWPRKDGVDQYGNTHYVTQDISKESREKGVRGPIIGNARFPEAEKPHKPAPTPEAVSPISDDDVPF